MCLKPLLRLIATMGATEDLAFETAKRHIFGGIKCDSVVSAHL